MTERNERVEALLRTFVIDKFREDGRGGHLIACPGLTVAELDAHDGTYGCDTGCSFVRFEATLTCPHGGRQKYHWGDFGELAEIIDEMSRA